MIAMARYPRNGKPKSGSPFGTQGNQKIAGRIVLQDTNRSSLGQQVGYALPSNLHRQRDNKGGHFGPGDESAADASKDSARDEGDQNGGDQPPHTIGAPTPVAHGKSGHDTAETHTGSLGQVNASGNQNEKHPNGHKHVQGILANEVKDIGNG